MKRNDWEFPVSTDTLTQAVRKKVAYHRERLVWWEKEHDRAVDEMKASMELRQHQVTGGTQHIAVFDQEKQQRVNECERKVSAHKADSVAYSAWLYLLESYAGTHLDCQVEDVIFFGLTDFSERLDDERRG